MILGGKEEKGNNVSLSSQFDDFQRAFVVAGPAAYCVLCSADGLLDGAFQDGQHRHVNSDLRCPEGSGDSLLHKINLDCNCITHGNVLYCYQSYTRRRL